jgi:glycosyltransferase involved in cell wall biosynthesis
MSDLQLKADIDQLKLDPNKPTIMVVSDSAAIHSGFAQVVRNIFRRLWVHREWNIVQFGWWHAQAMETVPWPIVTTNRDSADPNFVDQMDKYGEQSFEGVVASVRPDLVWVMGDPWMVGPALENSYSNSYSKVLYIPVDGAPLVYAWKICEKADVVVPYLPWGKKMIERWVPKAKVVDPIPHGVDTDMYKPLDPTMRQAIRHSSCKVAEDDVLILSVGRNQGRKNLPALIELMYYIRSGDYVVCSSCHKAYRNPFNYHLGQPTGEKAECKDPTCWGEYEGGTGHRSPKMLPGKPHTNAYLYLHTPINDLQFHSWKITDLLDSFGLGQPTEDGKELRYPGFRWNQHLQPVHGLNEADMANLYASADIFTLATNGEGFGLPLLESMSCGIPVVAPDTSSHPDFISEGGGMLVPIAYYINEPVSSYNRGYPDLDSYLTDLLLLIEQDKLRSSLGRAARETAKRYDWDQIAERWRVLINQNLKDHKPAKRWHRVTSV